MPTRNPPTSRAALAIGSFDGVHLGHQQIISRTLELAAELTAVPAVMTFSPLPAQLIHPDFTFVLTSLDEKLDLFIELGIESVNVVRFDPAVRTLDPARFVERYVARLHPAAVIVGHDHRFGAGRQGDVDLLSGLLRPHHIVVEIVPEFLLHGVPVRSTRIREHLLLGHMRLASELLGRHYSLGGRIVPGTGTGRRLGFPTLNIQVEDREKLVPADGVYAVFADLAGTLLPAVLNIGHRPTFQGEKRSIEAHVLDRTVEVRPTTTTIRFVERLRPERKFPDPSTLTRQIAEDVARARELLRGVNA